MKSSMRLPPFIKAKPFNMSSDAQAVGPPWTILKLLQWTAEYLQRHGIDQARSDAEILLAHTLRCQRIDLYLRYDQPLVADELSRFKALLKRRIARCPVAYILAEKEFWSLNLKVTPDVLIPRPETECLVETLLSAHSAETRFNVLELGTGSGAITIALAAERPGWKFWATDISGNAIAIAKHNATRHSVEGQIEFIEGHWFGALACGHTRFDLIVSNPPYIASGDLPDLEPEIREHEPIKALDGGPKGLDCIDHIIRRSPDYMVAGGQLVLEIGSDQAAAVKSLGLECGTYGRITITRDYGNLDRVAQLTLKVE